MTLVKICGNQTPDDIRFAASVGADFVGIVFAKSNRQVSVTQAHTMMRSLDEPLESNEFSLPPSVLNDNNSDGTSWFDQGALVIENYLKIKKPLTVGVFADQPIEQINEIVEELGIDLVQFSGSESWSDCLLVTKQVIKVVHVNDASTPFEIEEKIKLGFSIGLGLDSSSGKYGGGSGESFDWDIAEHISGKWPIMLSGGLNINNVTEAIHKVSPWMVDVSSGTETDGKKDYVLVEKFINTVHSVDLEV
ncbi:MAG: hypothetical protein CL792_00465 [Chloroflexi bacterium]|nr:hypothetical protein [Chloroflexota bacterium]|tara:strand:+ start:6270 stop:7016 length:747 start_codon:yes stop_codon:yes gene_type:complete